MGIGRLFLEALYPRSLTCDLCGDDAQLAGCGPGAFLCPACRALLLRPAPALSPGPSLDGAAGGVVYTDDVALLMRRFKYRRQWYLAQTLASFLPSVQGMKADVIVPVPLFPRREKKRGCNQSELLARCLSEETGLPVECSLLFRVRNTSSQTSLSSAVRARNVRGAFRADKAVQGRSIVLLDDVYTTGATMGECARALKAAGAARVFAVAVCVAEQEGDEGKTKSI